MVRGVRRLGMRNNAPAPDAVLDRLPHAIAAKVYAMRTLLGLSQQQLADKALVSQGAISRMESGECGAMPLRTIAAVFLALAVELMPLGDACTDEVRTLIHVVSGTFPMAVEDKHFTVLHDPGLDTLLRIYNLFSERERVLFLGVIQPLAELVVARSGEGQYRPG